MLFEEIPEKIKVHLFKSISLAQRFYLKCKIFNAKSAFFKNNDINKSLFSNKKWVEIGLILFVIFKNLYQLATLLTEIDQLNP